MKRNLYIATMRILLFLGILITAPFWCLLGILCSIFALMGWYDDVFNPYIDDKGVIENKDD